MLTSGTRFAGYEIVGPLGAGGMGVVYKARDTRLHRDVAIKILPEAFATDPERSARFEREAQTLAALNHPHIAQIYGFEDGTADGAQMRALVMEFVDGEDLAVRIARGPIRLDEIVAIARQVAEALEAAHEQGIIHRDLKPANIKLRPDGTVKVLDFGLAKLAKIESGTYIPDGGRNVATITSPAVTGRGVILGTAAYMSPEQARGKPVDKRADIWAFGVVLYEMLTGARAFDGETVSDTLAAVLTSSPDLSRLPSETPPRVRRLLQRCLDRDPSHRLRDIGEARIALSEPFTTSAEATSSDTKAIASSIRDRSIGSFVIAALAIVSLASLAFAVYAWVRVPTSRASDSYELAIASPRNTQFHIGSNSGNVIISPDGSKIAFIASSGVAGQLWVRSLARDDARPLSGTDRASNPFWAPDSRQLGFFANGKLRTATLDAGLPAVLADAHSGRGGSWSEDGVIIFTPRGGGTLSRISASGGAVEELTKLDLARGENAHYWPQVLPGSKDYLYFVRSTIPENNGIYLGHLDGRPPTRLISSLSSGVYAPPSTPGATGHLLWAQDGTLVAQSLNIARAALEGPVSTVVEGVRVEESQRAVFASVSNNGILAWADESAATLVLTLFNRAGTRLKTLPIDLGKLVQPEFSPDGKKVAFTSAGRGTADIWIHDIASGATTRVSNTATYEEQPTWSPDGLWVAYNGFAGDDAAVILARVDGSVAPRAALTANIDTKPTFTPDGRALLFVQPQTQGMALTVAPLADGLKPATVSLDDDLETGNAVWMSPDMRWVAMTALSGPTPEVRVVRIMLDAAGVKFGGQRITVGTNALYPRWSRNGRELFYQATDGYLMAVNVIGQGDGIAFGTPTRLLLLPSDGTGAGGNGWDVSLDGQLVVAVEAPHAAGQTLKVITNWQRRLMNAVSERP